MVTVFVASFDWLGGAGLFRCISELMTGQARSHPH